MSVLIWAQQLEKWCMRVMVDRDQWKPCQVAERHTVHYVEPRFEIDKEEWKNEFILNILTNFQL